jgi:hypothetical protein
MNWEVIANLILEIGLPAVESIVAKWEAKGIPTLAEFQAIRDQANQTATDRLKARELAAGVDPSSGQGKVLLELAATPPVIPDPPPQAS